MKVLFISQYYSPDITAAAFRVHEMAAQLRNRGHEVVTITTFPHKSESGFTTAGDDREAVIRVKVRAAESGGLLAYVEQYFGFAYRAFWKAVCLLRSRKFDVIWATSPPLFVGLTTLAISFFFRIPVVFDVRDIWPASAVDIGKIRGGSLLERLGRRLELAIYRRSAAFTCTTKHCKGYISLHTNKDVHVVYNGVPDDGIPLTQERDVDRNIICYAGNLGHAQGLDVVVGAFHRLVNRSGFEGARLRLVGGGAQMREIEADVAKRGISENVDFVGFVEKRVAQEELLRSGVLLVSLKDAKTFDNAIPSKIFDCMAVGNPIVATVRGEAAEILNMTGGNITTPPGDENLLCEAFARVIENWGVYRDKAMLNIELVRKLYTRSAAADSLELALTRVVKVEGQ